jgi:maleylpyruvate isomerase
VSPVFGQNGVVTFPGPPEVPSDDLARVADAQRRFMATIGSLDDAFMRRATPLPGWTVAHVLTHVARNADSHRHRAEAAAEGVVIDQYEGGLAGREQQIQAGATRPAHEVIADVAVSAELLAATWEGLPPSAWAGLTRDVRGVERPLRALPSRRWQELEVHVVDLAAGVTHRSWSDDFIAEWLPQLRASLPSRLPSGQTPPEPPEQRALDDRDLLAWLYGRLQRPGLPTLAGWG